MCIAVNAQKNGFISIHYGNSSATGDFAGIDPKNTYASYAKAGALLEISLGRKVYKNLGISLSGRIMANSTNAEALAKNEAQSQPSTRTIKVEASSWFTGGLYIGPYLLLPIGQNVTFIPKIQIGISNTSSPEIVTQVYNASYSATKTKEQAEVNSLGSIIGIGFDIKITRSVYLGIKGDYYSTNISYKQVNVSMSNGSSSKIDFTSKVRSLNGSLGIGILL